MTQQTPAKGNACPRWVRVPTTVGRRAWCMVLAGMWWLADCPAGPGGALPEFKPEAARDYLQTTAQAVQVQVGTDVDMSLILARLQGQLGEKQAAERLAREAMAGDPKRAEIPSFLAGLLIQQDRMEEAAALLRRALELKPSLPGAQRQLGMVLDRLGERDAARAAFTVAVEQAPGDATTRLLLGRLLLDQGQLEAAAGSLDTAARLDPTLAGAFYALSQAQDRLGNPEGARESLRKFAALKEQERTQLDAKNGSYNDAAFMQALAAGFHAEAAALFLRKQQLELAAMHALQSVAIAPQEPRGHELLAIIYQQSGRLAEARQACETLVRLQPKRATAQLNLGNLALRLKDTPAAVAALKAALELDPVQPEALNNLARLYLANGRDLPEALALVRRLTDLQPNAAHYDLLGWACFANGQADEARTAAAKAIELDPTNTVYRGRYERLQSKP